MGRAALTSVLDQAGCRSTTNERFSLLRRRRVGTGCQRSLPSSKGWWAL